MSDLPHKTESTPFQRAMAYVVLGIICAMVIFFYTWPRKLDRPVAHYCGTLAFVGHSDVVQDGNESPTFYTLYFRNDVTEDGTPFVLVAVWPTASVPPLSAFHSGHNYEFYLETHLGLFDLVSVQPVRKCPTNDPTLKPLKPLASLTQAVFV